MIKTALEKPREKAAVPRQWGLKFQRSPQEVLPTADGTRVRGVRMALTRLEVRLQGPPGCQTGRSRAGDGAVHPCSPWQPLSIR